MQLRNLQRKNLQQKSQLLKNKNQNCKNGAGDTGTPCPFFTFIN
jgi:hypothetical protein